jgi:hypothetical protein
MMSIKLQEKMVNTKLLMTSSSILLAAAGIFALFVPDVLLGMQGVESVISLSLLIQLMGALYFSFALMNWTAKDSAIGGVYARPVSVGNFAHFFAGTMLLLKVQFSAEFNLLMFVVFIVYAVYTWLFYWLVFQATGITAKN